MAGDTTRVGDVLASKYRLEELLGSGGMGHVYRAVNEDVGRAVAIKVLRSEHASNAPIVERFLREARAANLVRHPNVVDVLDIGRDGDGSPFIVQELLSGQDLAKYVDSRGGRLNLEEIEEYFLPVIDAVAEAHAKGVVHRDIKPENVFLAEQGRRRVPKLLDFGISKIRAPNIRVTEVGVMMGTPAYMAPEQIQGSRDADSRTDVWALGIMLFELLVGRLPFEASDAPQLFVAIATKDVPRLVELDGSIAPEISRVVERCLRRMPDERYPSALELSRDLRHVLEGTEIEPTQRISISPSSLMPVTKPEGRGAAAAAITKPVAKASPPTNDTTIGTPDLDVPDLPEMTIPDLVVPAKMSSAKPAALSNSMPAPVISEQDDGDDIPPDAPSIPSSKPAPLPIVPSLAAPLSSKAPSRLAPEQALPGVMLAPANAHAPPRRQQSPQLLYDPHALKAPEPVDMSILVGIAVVGLTAIGATAVLMTFAHRPEGFQVAGFVTKPTSFVNLIVNGGLALVALIAAGKTAYGSVKKWRFEVEGGRGSAVFFAAVAGALFFAAIELARAAG